LVVPASVEGPTAPPSGLGGLFVRPRDTEVHGPSGYASTDFLEMWELDVNWTTPANSTLTKLPDVPIAEYDCTLCGTGSDWSCMPQPGTNQALDPIREPLHQPLQYRNWGSYETLVGGFAEDVNGADQAAVRWFELRRVSGTWSAYQEGVVGGDAHHRSVTSVAMDGAGNIALGYTLTSSTVYPSIRYAGRLSTDPLGTMSYVDAVAQAGTGSQARYDRWGDYSGIGIDPADDRTFWYTTEYMSGSSSATRVISFKFGDAPPTETMHVGDLDGSAVRNPNQSWNATITVAVHDAAHGPVSGATVTGTWSAGATGTGTCTTNTSGLCSITKTNISKKSTSATFTVNSVTLGGYAYQPAFNHDPDGGSNGTVIKVFRP